MGPRSPVDGEDRAGAERMLAEAKDRAANFASAYAGKVADLDATGLDFADAASSRRSTS